MRNLSIILLAFVCLFYSCKQNPQQTTVVRVDTIRVPVAKTPDTVKRITTPPPTATVNVDDLYAKSRLSCPVAVKKCAIASLGHGSKAVIVTIQNNTAKKITAIKIWWIVYNKAGKQIGNSSGMAKKEVASHKSASYSWDINAPNGTHAKAFIYSLKYKDGFKWKVE